MTTQPPTDAELDAKICELTQTIAGELGIPLNSDDLLLGKKSILHQTHCKSNSNKCSCLVIFLLPLLLVVPIYICAWLVPCLQYTSTLQILTLGMFTAIPVLTFIRLILFNRAVYFCTPNSLVNHHIHSTILFAAMGATLGYACLFAYKLNIGYFIGMFVMFVICFIEYFIAGSQHHYHSCPFAGQPHFEISMQTFWGYDEQKVFIVLDVFFLLLWTGLLMVMVGLGHELWTSPGRADYVVYGCISTA